MVLATLYDSFHFHDCKIHFKKIVPIVNYLRAKVRLSVYSVWHTTYYKNSWHGCHLLLLPVTISQTVGMGWVVEEPPCQSLDEH